MLWSVFIIITVHNGWSIFCLPTIQTPFLFEGAVNNSESSGFNSGYRSLALAARAAEQMPLPVLDSQGRLRQLSVTVAIATESRFQRPGVEES